MFKVEEFFVKNNLKSDLKRYKSALTCSFIIGLLLGSIPFINRSKENFKIKKLMQEQKQIEIQNREKICKEENSEYKRFLSLGFPKTAIKKFNICMEK